MLHQDTNYKYEVGINNGRYIFIHPKLEVVRHRIMKVMFDRFYDVCNKYKMGIRREKLDTLLTLFCWTNITNIDPVIPYREDRRYNYEQLRIDLVGYGLDANKIIAELNLEEFLESYMNKFDRFYKRLEITHRSRIRVRVEGRSIIYNKKYVVNFTDKMISNLNKFYNHEYEHDKYVLYFCILYRYQILDGGNQQLAMDSSFKRDMKRHFSVNIELFGSCINRYYDKYCSLFYDIEKYFGSLGSFDTIKPIKGLYFANPPFDDMMMANMARKLVDALEETREALGFIVTVPVWDRAMQLKIAKRCGGNYITDYVEYRCKDILSQSRFMFKEYVFCKNDFPYYSIVQNRQIRASNTYMYIIKNDRLKFDVSLFEKILNRNKLYFIK